MPIEHEFEDGAALLVVRRSGRVTTHDEERACSERKNDARMRPGIPVLVDCTLVEPTDDVGTVKYVARCVTDLAATLGCGPVAIVVASQAEYGMGRMFMALTEPSHPQTRLFFSEPAAREWLASETTPSASDEISTDR